MASALLSRGTPGSSSGPPTRSRSTEILCAGESFSIVVDDHDPPEDDQEGGLAASGPRFGGSSSSIVEGEGEEEEYYTKNKEAKKRTDKKIAIFKSEAAARLSELQRLLEEHEEIIRDLRRSESVGRELNLAGVASAPSPASPSSGHTAPRPSAAHTPIKTSRTAPPSPASPQARPFVAPPTFLISKDPDSCDEG